MAFSLNLKRNRHLIKGAKPVSWVIADQTMVSATNFLTGLLLARFLGIEEFGRYVLVWMVAEFLNNIQDSLITSPMMSIGPKQSDDEVASYLGAVLVQQATIAVIAFALIILGGYLAGYLFPDGDVAGFTVPLAFAVLSFQAQHFVRRYLFMRGRALPAFICDVVRYPGQIMVLLWLAYQDSFTTIAVIWVIAGSSAVALLVGLCFVERPTLEVPRLLSIALRHWHLARWLTSSGLLRWLIVGMFNVSMGALIGTAAVGGIRAIQSLLGLTHIILLGIENVVPGQVARILNQRGPAAMISYLWRFGFLAGLPILAILVTIAAAPDFWLTLAYGPEYGGQGYVVRWLAVIYFGVFLTSPATMGLRAMERGFGIFLADLSAAVFSVVCCYPLVALLGVPGVMVGYSVIACLKVTILYLAFQKRLRQLMV
jgi:O-antigen/teichoic acid export membrane protein